MIATAQARTSSLVSDYLELTKPRLTSMAVLTTMASFYLGAQGSQSWPLFLSTLVGTTMMGAGGGALNQVMETDLDQSMRRTRNRPLPAGRISRRDATIFGVALSCASVLYLWILVNALTGALAALALVSYLLVYTPLKRKTPLSTVVGAVPGALPALMGWTAIRGEIGLEGTLLFAILYLWQIPHFLSIAWLYREDYARAGVRVLPVVSSDGRSTSIQVLLWTVALLPISLGPGLVGITGPGYCWMALLLGGGFLYAATRMAFHRDHATARGLLLASVAYLPLLQLSMLLGKVLMS